MKLSFDKMDPYLLLTTATLLVFGLIVMTSASAEIAFQRYRQPLHFFNRQLLFAVFALVTMWAMSYIKLDRIVQAHWLFLLLGLALLVLVLIPGVGYSVNGSQRWLDLGVIRVHASEFSRLLLVLFFAGWLSARMRSHRPDWSELWATACLCAMVSGLVLLQPDYGATVMFALTLIAMLYLAGARLAPMMIMVFAALPALAWIILASPYRLRRLQGFLDPFSDPYNSGFQLVQSLIAIGSGGLDGVGLGNSVQKMSFLPESHNDFIFSILAEEFGFIGVALVCVTYLVLILRILYLSYLAHRRNAYFASLLAAGIGVWFALQTLTNIGVATSILPTKGISLPFISYGGANLVVALIQIGLMMAVYRYINRPTPKTYPANRYA